MQSWKYREILSKINKLQFQFFLFLCVRIERSYFIFTYLTLKISMKILLGKSKIFLDKEYREFTINVLDLRKIFNKIL